MKASLFGRLQAFERHLRGVWPLEKWHLGHLGPMYLKEAMLPRAFRELVLEKPRAFEVIYSFVRCFFWGWKSKRGVASSSLQPGCCWRLSGEAWI